MVRPEGAMASVAAANLPIVYLTTLSQFANRVRGAPSKKSIQRKTFERALSPPAPLLAHTRGQLTGLEEGLEEGLEG